VSNLTHVLGFHPTYLQCVLTSFNVQLHDEGPLPQSWRFFIGAMACARHRCLYMFARMVDAFLSAGGDPDWLKRGLASPSLPPKLAALAEINALLAHRPWVIAPLHVRDLTDGTAARAAHAAAGGGDGTDASGGGGGSGSGWGWSLHELVHALVILATFHSLCSIIQVSDV